jgi:hypothetical protein
MHFVQWVRGRLGEVMELHGLAALGTLADQTFTEPNGMLAHFCDQLLAHIEAGFEIELARALSNIDRAAAVFDRRRWRMRGSTTLARAKS